MPKLIDIGANLTHESFSKDFDEVTQRALEAGVSRILLTGTDLESSRTAQRLSASNNEVFSCTAGLHPHLASAWDTCAEEIKRLCEYDEVVAVGECGLDFNRNFSPRDAQIYAFEQQLEVAQEIGKPVFLHQRESHETFYPILKAKRAGLAGGVVHCFTDSREALEDYLNLDMHIGITGWVCDERRGHDLQNIVKYIPLNRLLIETDAPYLLPRTLKPKPKSRRNEPCYLSEVVTALAEHMGRNFDEIAQYSTENALRLFGLENKQKT